MEIHQSSNHINNPFQGYKLNLSLPFTIQQSNFKKSNRYDRDGHWNQKERLKYSVFLDYFQSIMQDPMKKKKVRIYQMMSDMIVTRNSNQCRSHHQKMEKYRNNIRDIINSVAQKYEPSVYNQISRKYLLLIQPLLENSQKYRRYLDKNSKNIKQTIIQPQLENIKSIQEINNFNVELPNINCQPSLCNQNYQEFGEIKNIEKQSKKQVIIEQKKMSCQKKQKDIKTNDNYEDQQIQQNEELNGLGFIEFKQENQQRNYQPTYPQIQSQQPIFLNMEGSYPRNIYEQKLMQFKTERNWHIAKANELYRQWDSEVRMINYCNMQISAYSQMLGLQPQRQN